MNYKVKLKELKKFLQNLKLEEIETLNEKKENAKLRQGYSSDEHIPKTTHYQQIIQYGQPFLIDAIGNDLSVVVLSKRKYKLPTGRAIKAKFIETLVDNCQKQFGTPLNGYWIIPSQFIELK